MARSPGNKTPYDLFTAEQGEEIATLFGTSRIAANDVTLRPSLLGVEVKVREGVSPAETVSAGKCPPVHRHTSRTDGGDQSHPLVPKKHGAPGMGELCHETAARRAEQTPRAVRKAVLGTTKCTFGTTRCDRVPSRHSFSRIYSDKSPENVKKRTHRKDPRPSPRAEGGAGTSRTKPTGRPDATSASLPEPKS